MSKLVEMIEVNHPNQITQSLLTFLSRVLTPSNDQKVSVSYQKIITSFTTNKLKNVEPALRHLAKDKQNLTNDELILHKFVYNLIQ